MRLRRSFLIVVTAGAAVMLAAPGLAVAEPQVGDYFSAQEIARAEQYRSTTYLLGFSALGLSVAAAALLGLGLGSRLLGAWSNRFRNRWVRRTILLTVVVTVVPTLVVLPFSAARHAHDRRFGLATNSLLEHLWDVVKASGFEIVIAVASAVVFVFVARRLPRAWPAIIAAGGAILTVALVYLFPVVYEPVFNDFEQADADTRARVLRIAEEAGVDVNDVLIADASRRTTRQNAYVSGIGSTRRVVLYDTLIAKMPPEQLEVVVAHELVHERNDDVLRGTLLGAAGVMIAVAVLALSLRSDRLRRFIGADGPGDPRVVPFLAFFIVAASLVTQPVVNALSRQVEARADRGAIAITADPDAAIGLQVELARDNLSDLTPSAPIVWMFYSHPPVMERIEIALEAGGGRR